MGGEASGKSGSTSSLTSRVLDRRSGRFEEKLERAPPSFGLKLEAQPGPGLLALCLGFQLFELGGLKLGQRFVQRAFFRVGEGGPERIEALLDAAEEFIFPFGQKGAGLTGGLAVTIGLRLGERAGARGPGGAGPFSSCGRLFRGSWHRERIRDRRARRD